jgi:hypothetical protein
MTAEFFNSIHPSRPFAAVVAARLLRPWQRIRGPSAVTQDVTIFGTVTLASLVRSTRALQDCSDRVLAEPDMAADQPVAQTSLCQLEDLLRLAVRWTLSWLAAEPLTAGLGGGDAGLDGLVVTVMPKVTLRKIRNFKALPFILCRN